ncbi:MAG: aquaporin [Labrys sp. (in: a-proteobacteria)]
MAYAVGPISGGHFNPAVTAGLAAAGRISWSQFLPYTVAQLVGAIAAAVVLYLVASGTAGFSLDGGFAANRFGLCLTLIHLISIPVTNTSVNPARSTSQALFAGGWALQQLWLFGVAPIAGAVIAGIVHKAVLAKPAA